MVFSVNCIVGDAFFAKIEVFVTFFTVQITEEFNGACFVFNIFGDQRYCPAGNGRAVQSRRIQVGISRSVNSDINFIRVFLVQRSQLGSKVRALVQHREVTALSDFFFHLRTFVNKDIFRKQAVLVRLTQSFHPADIFRVSLTVIQLAVFFSWNSQEVLNVLFQRIVTGCGKFVQTERNHRLTVDFGEFLFSCLQRGHETFRCAHIRAANRFINIFADYEGLVGYISIAIFLVIFR